MLPLKLDTMRIKVGYPDQFGDYSNLQVSDHSYLENMINITSYYYLAGLLIADTPSNPDTWYFSPQSVDAYYDNFRNMVVLPAGVLQPPFYDPLVDDAEHYGAIGSIIGHEITLGFDSPLSIFVNDNNTSMLWNSNDSVTYQETMAPLVAQFDQMETLPGLHINGTRTLTESAGRSGRNGNFLECLAEYPDNAGIRE